MTRLSTVVWPWHESVQLLLTRKKVGCASKCSNIQILRQSPFCLRHVWHIPQVCHNMSYCHWCKYRISFHTYMVPNIFPYSMSKCTIPLYDFETKTIDVNIPKCFRDGTAMYSWDSKSPTWAAQVKLAFFCCATCQTWKLLTYLWTCHLAGTESFWFGSCFLYVCQGFQAVVRHFGLWPWRAWCPSKSLSVFRLRNSIHARGTTQASQFVQWADSGFGQVATQWPCISGSEILSKWEVNGSYNDAIPIPFEGVTFQNRS